MTTGVRSTRAQTRPLLIAIAAAVCLAAGQGCIGSAGERAPLRVAAAADLKFALDEVVARYRDDRPTADVRVSFGSSGLFFAQLSKGAPFDLFLSADASYPRRLVEAGVALAGSEFPYAVGRIVLWVPEDSTLRVETGLQALLGASVRRIAIANPDHAPYGAAARAALERAGIYERVKGKLVLGENAAQTAQFAQSGSADAAIIPLSLAIAPALASGGRRWLIPLDAHPKLEQVGVRMRSSTSADEARRFAEFLAGPEGRAILRRFGFLLPGE